MKQYILRAEMTASRLCAVAVVIAASLLSPVSVAAVTEMVYPVPGLLQGTIVLQTAWLYNARMPFRLHGFTMHHCAPDC